MSSNTYNNGLLKIADRTINYVGDTLRVMLVDAAYTFNAAHVAVADITNEIVATNYVRKDLAGKSIVGASNVVSFLADSVVWLALGPPTSGPTPAKAVVYKFNVDDAGSLLIACIDFPDQTLNGSDCTLDWNATPSNGAVFTVTG
jgi:hypothetical protein